MVKNLKSGKDVMLLDLVLPVSNAKSEVYKKSNLFSICLRPFALLFNAGCNEQAFYSKS